MKYYAAFLEGLTPSQEEQLTSILFIKLCQHLIDNPKNSKLIHIDKKIYLQEKIFFNFDKKTRLLETECVKDCKTALIKISKDLGLEAVCIDFFKNLKFATSKEEALMLSNNGLLFSQTPRIHKTKHTKKIILFNGIVSSEFAINEVLTVNSGLVFGHDHNDIFSYTQLIDLLPICKLQKIKTLYLELPYASFSPLLAEFTQNKTTHKLIQELKKGANKLYQNKDFLKKYVALLVAAKAQGIAIQACDVNSLNFINYSEQFINEKHRLNVGNACMIRSIETLQFKQHHPKFILLVGLAHAQNIAHELGVPSCFIGHEQILREYSDLTRAIDYSVNHSGTFRAQNSNFFLKPNVQLDQTMDPKINEVISHWNALIKKIPRFSQIVAAEAKAAREVYLEYILQTIRSEGCKISDICKTQQSLVIESLTQAIYSKCVELTHPKNWYPLFYCQQPYGIRLAKNEKNAFSIKHLNDLEASQMETMETNTELAKLHYA